MKKIYSLVLVIIFLLSMSVSVFAVPLKASTTFGTAVIDGTNTKGEWDNVTAYPIDKFKQTTGTPGKTKGTFKTKWDGSSLYVFVEVQDDTVSKSGDLEGQDRIQTYIEYDNSGSGQYKDPTEKEYQFAINRGGAHGQYDCIPFELDKNLEKSVISTATGYTIEYKLNLKGITGETLTKDKEIGFDIQINDLKGSERLAAYGWNDQYDEAWQDVSALGKLTLTAQKAEETAKPSETPTASATPAAETQAPSGQETQPASATPTEAQTEDQTIKPTANPTNNNDNDDEIGKRSSAWILILVGVIVVLGGMVAYIINKSKKSK